jgi:PIN domain nuclease of toxin-antitoxin system
VNAEPPAGVLLDTCAVIFMMEGLPMARLAIDALLVARPGRGILVSVISAWEIGLIARRGRKGRAPQFRPDPRAWFERVMTYPGIQPAPYTPDIAIAASFLPGDMHGDPADRLLVATARDLGVPLITRDARIRAYGQAGHVNVVAC